MTSCKLRDRIGHKLMCFILDNVCSAKYGKMVSGAINLGLHCAADDEVGPIIDSRIESGEWPKANWGAGDACSDRH